MRVQIVIKDHVVINAGEDIRLEVEVGELLDDVLAIVENILAPVWQYVAMTDSKVSSVWS